jgi:hypothetical protein
MVRLTMSSMRRRRQQVLVALMDARDRIGNRVAELQVERLTSGVTENSSSIIERSPCPASGASASSGVSAVRSTRR